MITITDQRRHEAAESVALFRATLADLEAFNLALFNDCIDRAWSHGFLPLPSLEWGLRGPWYLGDLR